MGVANCESEKGGGKRSGAWHIERGLADCGRQSKRTFSMTAISACKYRKDEKQQREGRAGKAQIEKQQEHEQHVILNTLTAHTHTQS